MQMTINLVFNNPSGLFHQYVILVQDTYCIYIQYKVFVPRFVQCDNKDENVDIINHFLT